MRRYLLAFCALFFFQSCSKDSIPAGPDQYATKNKLSPMSRIVPEADVLGATDSTVSIRKTAGQKAIVVGSILIASPSPADSLGFMRKVTSVTDRGSSYILATEYASLDEVFDELHIDTVFHTGFTMAGNMRTTGTKEFSLSGELFPGVAAEGTVDLAFPTLHFIIDKDSPSGGISYDMFVQSSIISSGIEFSTTEKKIINLPAYTVYQSKPTDLPPIHLVIPTGFFLLYIPLFQKVTVGVGPLEIGGKMNLKFNPSLDAKMGVRYTNGSFEPISEFRSPPAVLAPDHRLFDPFAALFAKVTLIRPYYKIAPYDSQWLSFGLSAPLDVEAQIQFASPNYSITLKSKVTGGINSLTSFFGGKEVTLAKTFDIYSTTASGDWPIDTAGLLTAQRWELANGPVKGFGKVANCPDLEIPWWVLEKASIGFESSGNSFKTTESREGKCLFNCDPFNSTALESTDTLKCVITSYPPLTPAAGNNAATVELVNNKFKVLAFDGYSKSLGWLVTGGVEIVSLSRDKLVLRNRLFNEKDLVFTPQR